MKKFFTIFVSLGLFLASCTSTPQTETASPLPDPFTLPWEDRSIYASGLILSQQPILEELKGASVYHLELSIAEDLYHVSGHQEVHYTNTEEIPLSEVQFRLFPNILGGEMNISNLKVNNQDVSPQLELDNSLLVVPLTEPLAPEQSAVIGMDFEVTVPREIERNYGMLAYYDNILALAHAYPMIAVYDDEGWNAEIPAPYGDITYTDPAFYIVKLTAPKDVTLVTSGNVIERGGSGNLQTLHIASGPARDFFLAASPDFEETSKMFGEVTIRSYAPIGLQDGSKEAVEIAADSLELFSASYSAYPYTELDLVTTPTVAGGIEYPAAIVIALRLYDLESDSPVTRQYLEGLVAHEVAHQWFYNLVGDDQLDDPWLDEALAQYLTYEYFTDEYGPGGEAGFRQSLEARWESVNYADIPIGLPVVEYEEAEYGAIVYGRGPLFFIALRDEMGEQVFRDFLKDYTEKLAWGIATPELLHSMAEEHCACDLDPIFNEWVYP